jgi:DNA modification methylase
MTPPDRAPSPKPRRDRPSRDPDHRDASRFKKPPLRVLTTTLWEYPSQHYESFVIDGEVRRAQAPMQGDKAYIGATPSWIIWQLLVRYTREKDLVVDPMCGSGTTIDVCKDLGRRFLGYDLTPARPDIFRADARKLPLEDAVADFAFVDPPYSTHVEYSDQSQDIGHLDAGGPDAGRAYYEAMDRVFAELHRVLKNRRYLAVYVSDSWRKRKGGGAGTGAGLFMPIGFELYSRLAACFKPVDIIAVVRHNQKLARGNWRQAAEEGNFFLRGFNYLLIFKKEDSKPDAPGSSASAGRPRPAS